MPAAESSNGADLVFAEISKEFHSSVKHPEVFLSVQPKKEEKFKKITKNLYDLSVHLQDAATRNDANILPELILESMDEEQLWQQLELRNNSMMAKFLRETSRLLSLNEKTLQIECRQPRDDDEEEKQSKDGAQEDELEESGEDDGLLEKEDDDYEAEVTRKQSAEAAPKRQKQKSGKKSIVDDQFFKLNEMEEFLKAEDEKEMMKQKRKPGRNADDDGGEIDYFRDDSSEGEDDEDKDSEEGLKYGDFFDQDEDDGVRQKGKKLKTKRGEPELLEDADDGEFERDEESGADDEEYADNEEEEKQDASIEGSDEEEQNSSKSDNEDDGKPKSSFEERQERLRQRIEEHEEHALNEKPWQLKGEITATGRPQNSLLQEILEFDSTTRPAPVITEETTLRLEDIIRQRIKDKAWDDVERKHKPVHTPQELRKKLVLDQEKSKQSLAQIYEKEYRSQLEKLNPNEADEKEEEPESHKLIRKLMNALFSKLDALSNFHYTPRQAIPEPRIVTNTPAIEAEEVAPVAVSTAKMLAPEEVRDRAKGDVLGRSERSRTDKNRERRKKKLKQKVIAKHNEEKLQSKQKAGVPLSSKEEKSRLMKNVMKHKNVEQMNTMGAADGATKSSKAFFTQLQDKISTGKDVKAKRKAPKETVSAKRLKL